jgi:hypothetical protein
VLRPDRQRVAGSRGGERVMSDTIINFADYRPQSRRSPPRQQVAVVQDTTLDILNRIAMKLGLPPLEEDERGAA